VDTHGPDAEIGTSIFQGWASESTAELDRRLQNLYIPLGPYISARISTSVLTANMWWAHTTDHNNLIAVMAKIIPKFPNASFFPSS